MNYTDTYIACTDLSALNAFLSMFSTKMSPVQGRASVPATEELEEQPANGDPSLWYSCVRGVADITPMVPAQIIVIDDTLGASVVGVWA